MNIYMTILMQIIGAVISALVMIAFQRSQQKVKTENESWFKGWF